MAHPLRHAGPHSGDYARIGWWTGMIYLAGMVIILFAPRTDTGELQD